MYSPNRPPSESSQVAEWAFAEFIQLSRLLNDGTTSLILTPQAVEPTRPREGMTVNANGTNWNPGGGAGLYQYLGAAWVKL